MKKRVGVISIWDIDNYGNRLQNYALVSAINHLGYEAKTLKLWPQKKWKRIFQYVTNYDVSLVRILLEALKGNKRKVSFLKFERTYIQKDRRFFNSEENADYLNKTYQAFALGSDQIWNPVFLGESYFFGAFAGEKNMTFSYAASMGVSELSESNRESLRKGLATVKKVSVREDRAAEIIEELGMERAEVVLDPTMLIELSEWESLEKKPDYIDGEYIVLYYLGELSKERMDALLKYCKKNQFKMIVLGKAEYQKYYSAGPAEFLYLIHHAKLVCTDSFHGCVFSILFHTPFHVFERENSVQKMNSRLDTLLSTFGMGDRKYDDKNSELKLECDFLESEVNLKKKKNTSLQFLIDVLSEIE